MSEDTGEITRRQLLKLGGASLSAALLKPIDLPPSWEGVWGSLEYKMLLRRNVMQPGNLGGKENYGKGLGVGLGFATLHGDEVRVSTGPIVNQMSMLKSKLNFGGLRGVDMTQTEKWFSFYGDSDGTGIFRKMVDTQSNLTPLEALESDQVIGFISTRSPMDQLHRYGVYGVDRPYDPTSLRFVGIVLVADAPARTDWDKNLSKNKYSYLGWNNLSWVADMSSNVFKQLPYGLSGKADSIEGRPGVLLIDEDYIRKINK